MKGYASRVFSVQEVAAYEVVREAVEKIPDERWPNLRCHELARAVSRLLIRRFTILCRNCRIAQHSPDGRTSHGIEIGPCNCDTVKSTQFMVSDGKVGCIEHSWITLPSSWREKHGNAILDPYCPGRFPLVQLVDASVQMLPNEKRVVQGGLKLRLKQQYEAGDRRTDIDAAVVQALDEFLKNERLVR